MIFFCEFSYDFFCEFSYEFFKEFFWQIFLTNLLDEFFSDEFFNDFLTIIFKIFRQLFDKFKFF